VNPFSAKFLTKVRLKIQRAIRKISLKTSYKCPICENNIGSFVKLPDYYFEMFDKYKFEHSLDYFETFNFLKYTCPICGSSDRNRLYAIYLKERVSHPERNNKKLKFLDIAPDLNLSTWIKKNESIDYRSVDLYMPGVDDKADITDLNIYDTSRFDIILCSHVLEHIENDRLAMSEIFRVLKPGGFAIIMVPILLTLKEDIENSLWKTESERWKYFGQNDHVRLYSKPGFIKKLQETGFKVNELSVDYFSEAVFERNAINSRSVLYVVEK
jgi:predicted SAM-dependent methyltransferase